MAFLDSLRFIHESNIRCQHSKYSIFKNRVGRGKEHSHSVKFPLSSFFSRQDAWSFDVSNRIWCPINSVTYGYKVFLCQSFWGPNSTSNFPILKEVALTLARSYNAFHATPVGFQLVPAVGVIAFAMWGLGPLMHYSQKLFLHQAENNWKKARNYYVLTSYLQPLLLWTGAILVCRALDPVTLPSEASQIVKQRLLNFVKSLSTVLAFAYCLSSLIQQMRKFFVDGNDANDTRNMSFQFAGKAVYTAVWIAAISLFMELLGFSTQKWLTAGGLGTVLLTLAGREIFTNFLSSVMIHATRPFVLNEWIQTKIEGYEVSGTVEHVGWWSPTVIRGEDREAIHIPNHKFTVTVVRNLSQKTHWRIKTHLAISHLDVNKINNIVADMRKVLAKNPQVEQQRLHRRVFLDNIDRENQALLIMISCFVKTSHFEEYLCVKEAVLLDLLRVIRHHRARLATPIRTMQKIHPDPDLEHNPFTDFSRSRPANNRPYLLIEPPYRIHGNDKAKTTSAQTSDIQDIKTSEVSESKTSSSEEPLLDRSDKRSDKDQPTLGRSDKRSKKEDSIDATGNTESDITATRGATSTPLKPHKGKELPEIELEEELNKSPTPGEKTGGPLTSSQKKNGNDRSSNASPQPTRPSLEDNIVLGVALEGSKRTLPIEEVISPPTHLDGKELAACRNGNNPSTSTREKKQENQISTASGTTVTDSRDQER